MINRWSWRWNRSHLIDKIAGDNLLLFDDVLDIFNLVRILAALSNRSCSDLLPSSSSDFQADPYSSLQETFLPDAQFPDIGPDRFFRNRVQSNDPSRN